MYRIACLATGPVFLACKLEDWLEQSALGDVVVVLQAP